MESIVIIPTYNEVDNVRKIAEQILELYPEIHILFVDDNSPDGTLHEINKLCDKEKNRVFIFTRNGKRGLALAYKDGIRYALEKKYDYKYY